MQTTASIFAYSSPSFLIAFLLYFPLENVSYGLFPGLNLPSVLGYSLVLCFCSLVALTGVPAQLMPIWAVIARVSHSWITGAM